MFDKILKFTSMVSDDTSIGFAFTSTHCGSTFTDAEVKIIVISEYLHSKFNKKYNYFTSTRNH